MKLATAALFLSSLVGTASALGPMRATADLMKAARKLEDANNGDDAAEEEEYSFLANYKLKFLICKPGETYVNPEDGEYEYSSVVFRLCPDNGECDDEDSTGCSSGYGDFVVGVNSFVESYLEDKAEDMQQDDAWDVNQFAECREYEADQDADEDEDGGNNNNQNYAYYVGPACSEDGSTIILDMFTDEGCKTKSEDVTFEDISNGVSLPYSTGGLISNYCESCSGYNDNGEWELSEMCMMLYENAGKCETEMETFHYSGMNEASCEYIEEMLPKSKSSAGKAIGWTFFVLVVLGAAFVGFTFIKKKRGDDQKSFGLMSS